MKLGQKLDEARAEVARLERQAVAATCAELGRHTWVSIGGCNCGCFETSACSVPIHECTVCGTSDYGENDEAAAIRSVCPCPEEYDAELRLALTAGSKP